MKFEALSEKHQSLLFQFELENKAWFESLIAPRADDFYNEMAIKKHIKDSLEGAKSATSYSGVLLHNNVIVARANLRDINYQYKTCSVGYRVDQHSTGKGYASYCLAELIQNAKVLYSVKTLYAQVLDNNLASKKVLTKLGFQVTGYDERFTEINGKHLGCTNFRYRV